MPGAGGRRCRVRAWWAGLSVREDENVPELMVWMVAQQCTSTHCHRTAHLKMGKMIMSECISPPFKNFLVTLKRNKGIQELSMTCYGLISRTYYKWKKAKCGTNLSCAALRVGRHTCA